MRSLRNAAQQICSYVFLVLFMWTSIAHAAKRDSNDEMKLVCYYANWAIYRPGFAKFTPENINPFLCTHLIYAFAGMNKNYELKPFDSYNDVQLGNFQKFVNLKTYNPKLKTMIAIGGWNEGSKRFSKLVESTQSRLRFVQSAISFMRKHGFDGLDLDWEYPGSREGGQDEDKMGYAKLVTELREAFDSENVPAGKSKLLLTMAVPAGKQYIDKGYDIPTLSKHLDFFNMLTYDYHTGQEATVNHHAPLREMPDLEEWDPNKLLNIEWTVKYYIKKGADPKKLVVGIPTYGRSFTLADPDETDIGAPAEGPGEKGDATREGGYLAYYEICQMIQEKDWDLEAPYPELMGPYAYKDNQWVGFDDEDIIIEKVKFIVKYGLGGGMVWTLDNDDFRGKCYGEQSPLINTLKTALQEGAKLLKEEKTTTTPAPQRTTPRASRRQQIAKTTSKPIKTTTPKITTPPPFTTPDPGPAFECEDEGFFNNPTDCKKYFWCLDSGPSNLGLVAHSFTCPSGLYFNKARDSCDYASNVVCRVKKITTTSTTPKPKPRPRSRKTTTTTTTTTTEKPIPKDIQDDLDALKAPLNSINMNGQNLMELLTLLQQLGVNQIHDKLHGRESSEATSTLSPAFPQYRSPNRLRPKTTTSDTPTDLFNQYAKPDRNGKSDSVQSTVKPRGPQYHVPAPVAEEVNHEDLEDEEVTVTSAKDSSTKDDASDGFDFPFVYQTPSRRKHKTSTTKMDVFEEEFQEPSTSTTTPKPKPTPANRRVVVRLRPIPGEGKRRNPPGTLLIATKSDNEKPENRRNSNYVLAQTIGVRRLVRPNVLDEPTTKEERTTTVKPSTRRPRPATRTTPRTTTERYRTPPAPKELIVLPTGRPAVPATTRRYSPYQLEPREPALALLPDGGVTCLRRGVYPHPKECAKFLVCVPADDSDEFDGFIHDCPKNTIFMDDRGRCMPGDESQCGGTRS